jgi:hypothetical protein
MKQMFSQMDCGRPISTTRRRRLRISAIRRMVLLSIGGLCLLATPRAASAIIVNTTQSLLIPESGTITFSEYAPGAYAAVPYSIFGGRYDGSEVIFGSYFQGQVPQGVDPVTIPGPPTSNQPLQLLFDSNDFIEITNDPGSSTSPVLAGGPLTFRQPISVQFTTPVQAVGLTAGFLDVVNSITISAYDANGNPIGTVTNDQSGFEMFALVAIGTGISGLTIQGTDPAGFEIDNVFLATPMPEPAGAAMLLVGVASMVFMRRRNAGT